MSYDEERARKSRVVVETPTERREIEHEAVRVPERSGVSATTVGVLVVLVVALVTILVLMLMNNQSTTDTMNSNAVAEQPTPAPQTTIVQQPAAQPPIIVTQPAPPAPVIVSPPAPTGGSSANGSDDTAIQARIDKRIAYDPGLSPLGITATVLDGKVLLIGTVKSEGQKAQVEKAVREIKGVKTVDNQITVSG